MKRVGSKKYHINKQKIKSQSLPGVNIFYRDSSERMRSARPIPILNMRKML